jgi:hypothetical protein
VPDTHSYKYCCLVKEKLFRDKWSISRKRWSEGIA